MTNIGKSTLKFVKSLFDHSSEVESAKLTEGRNKTNVSLI
jgi:hypothetical protein